MSTATKPTKRPRRKAALPSQPFAGAVELSLHPEHLRDALALTAPDAPTAGMGEDDGCDPLEDVEIRDGVAVVRVQGMLIDRACWWCENYQDITARTKAAFASPAVRAVVLSFDSPGGMVSGLFDAMRALRAAKASSGKRCVAHTSTGAYSAAYGLASIADEIAVTDIAGVGSIGVIDQLVSRAGELEAAGIDVRVIASGTEKTDGHQAVPISKGAESRKRARVMQLAGVLSAEVTAGRPTLTAAQITELDAGVRYGREAIAAGLADRIATLDEVIAGLAAQPSPSRPFGATTTTTPAAASAAPQRPPMSEKLLAAITAATGETDPDRQLGALQATFDAAKRATAAEAELASIRAERASEKAAAEKAARTQAFEAALAKGLADAKLTPAEAAQWREDFGKGECSLGVLEGNLARRAPIPALTEEHKATRPPATPVPATNASRVAELVAKGYAKLTWDERNTLAGLDRDTFDRLHNAWVAAGRPAA